jgi:RND superfamily putative drug exporter
MLQSLASFVARHWLVTILFWIGLVIAVRSTTPAWDSVTYDGDLAYMPASMPSVRGEALLRRAFPEGRAKSDIVVIVAREDRPLDADDVRVAKELASRFLNILGATRYLRARELAGESPLAEVGSARDSLTMARQAFEEASAMDDQSAAPLHNLAIVENEFGEADSASEHRVLAGQLDETLRAAPQQLAGAVGVVPLADVWTRYTEYLGDKLVSGDKQAELIVLRLSHEFMATDNIPLLREIEEIVLSRRARELPAGLQISLTGSAAIGGDMLRSAAESIKNTELYTVLLVVAILMLVYRSPVLVVVPLFTIGVSLMVATGLVAALTQVHLLPGFEWWNFKIFTTTKIFVVVILFGAGTDFCLFLIARYREELNAGYRKTVAVERALIGVSDALLGSALTTILGLGTMFFAQFGKFRNSGPAIGLCLFVTLLACLSFAPALLRALGSSIFWPFGSQTARRSRRGATSDTPVPVGGDSGPATRAATTSAEETGQGRFWQWMAEQIIAHPATILVTAVAVMMPFAMLGANVQVTYDLLSELEPARMSKEGVEILRRHFPIGESGPLVVLAQKPAADLDSPEGSAGTLELTRSLYLPGVQSVRSIAAPTGKKPAARRSLFDFAKINHQMTRDVYLSKEPGLNGDVARIELILDHDPFSLEAIQVLNQVDKLLHEQSNDETSYWHGGTFVFSGTTAAIRDLREVTRADNFQIQILVVLAVLLILLLILRRPMICIYLILSVLFSYYVTIGATELYFRWMYGDTFAGLDWKVPLFLFVILVAIGQDYNIYLATRVFEEQREYGMLEGLRRAIIRTGGIITSCGVIMAGTFISMMTGTLRGIAELGFALSLGVILDTFVVRTILVPAFLAIVFRWHERRHGASSESATEPTTALARATRLAE